MPHNRPRVGVDTAPPYAFVATTLLVIFGFGLLMAWSGAIETLNRSGLFGG
jgi:hypothetical protein